MKLVLFNEIKKRLLDKISSLPRYFFYYYTFFVWINPPFWKNMFSQFSLFFPFPVAGEKIVRWSLHSGKCVFCTISSARRSRLFLVLSSWCPIPFDVGHAPRKRDTMDKKIRRRNHVQLLYFYLRGC